MMMEDEPEDAMPPTPEAMMQAEPDLIPRSTPMMILRAYRHDGIHSHAR